MGTKDDETVSGGALLINKPAKEDGRSTHLTTRSSKVLAQIAIRANDNKVFGDGSRIINLSKPNFETLSKFKNSMNLSKSS